MLKLTENPSFSVHLAGELAGDQFYRTRAGVPVLSSTVVLTRTQELASARPLECEAILVQLSRAAIVAFDEQLCTLSGRSCSTKTRLCGCARNAPEKKPNGHAASFVQLGTCKWL